MTKKHNGKRRGNEVCGDSSRRAYKEVNRKIAQMSHTHTHTHTQRENREKVSRTAEWEHNGKQKTEWR